MNSFITFKVFSINRSGCHVFLNPEEKSKLLTNYFSSNSQLSHAESVQGSNWSLLTSIEHQTGPSSLAQWHGLDTKKTFGRKKKQNEKDSDEQSRLFDLRHVTSEPHCFYPTLLYYLAMVP